MTELNYLNKDNAEFEKTAGGFLNVKTGGEVYESVKLVKTFPYTAQNQFISVRISDEDETEIGMIHDVEKDFTGSQKGYIEDQLAVRYFTPVIQKVISVRDQGGYSYFETETDAGPRRFVLRTNENAFIKLTETRIFIEDLENNRYEIPVRNALTAKERKKLEIFL